MPKGIVLANKLQGNTALICIKILHRVFIRTYMVVAVNVAVKEVTLSSREAGKDSINSRSGNSLSN